jgi:hypothetical protein
MRSFSFFNSIRTRNTAVKFIYKPTIYSGNVGIRKGLFFVFLGFDNIIIKDLSSSDIIADALPSSRGQFFYFRVAMTGVSDSPERHFHTIR